MHSGSSEKKGGRATAATGILALLLGGGAAESRCARVAHEAAEVQRVTQPELRALSQTEGLAAAAEREVSATRKAFSESAEHLPVSTRTPLSRSPLEIHPPNANSHSNQDPTPPSSRVAKDLEGALDSPNLSLLGQLGLGSDDDVANAYAAAHAIHDTPLVERSWHPLAHETNLAASIWHDPGKRFALQAPVGNAQLVSFVPRNEAEMFAVYGHDLRNPGALARGLEKTQRELASERAFFAGDRSLRGIEEYMRTRSEGGLFVFLGHSEDFGRTLVLPSGTRLDAALLHARCMRLGTPCLVLTCHGPDFALNTEITAEEALLMWRASRTLLEKNPDLSIGAFIDEMRSARAANVGKRRAAITLTVVVSVGGLTYLVINETGRN